MQHCFGRFKQNQVRSYHGMARVGMGCGEYVATVADEKEDEAEVIQYM